MIRPPNGERYVGCGPPGGPSGRSLQLLSVPKFKQKEAAKKIQIKECCLMLLLLLLLLHLQQQQQHQHQQHQQQRLGRRKNHIPVGGPQIARYGKKPYFSCL